MVFVDMPVKTLSNLVRRRLEKRMVCDADNFILVSFNSALKLGYLAMQFNSVVSTNTVAVNLWQKLGFSIIGTIPKAYRHKRLGLIDSYIMYKWLSGSCE